VNQAMCDLLDTTLNGWFSYLASWQAPGETGRSGCEDCADSPFSRLDGLGDWPHDIVHSLVISLGTAVRHVQLTLEELDEASRNEHLELSSLSAHERAARRAVLAKHAETLVLRAVSTRIEVMRDVLDQCVEPALDEYLRSECERGLLAMFAADDRDRPVY
jgi:hypothetical protein